MVSGHASPPTQATRVPHHANADSDSFPPSTVLRQLAMSSRHRDIIDQQCYPASFHGLCTYYALFADAAIRFYDYYSHILSSDGQNCVISLRWYRRLCTCQRDRHLASDEQPLVRDLSGIIPASNDCSLVAISSKSRSMKTTCSALRWDDQTNRLIVDHSVSARQSCPLSYKKSFIRVLQKLHFITKNMSESALSLHAI